MKEDSPEFFCIEKSRGSKSSEIEITNSEIILIEEHSIDFDKKNTAEMPFSFDRKSNCIKEKVKIKSLIEKFIDSSDQEE